MAVHHQVRWELVQRIDFMCWLAVVNQSVVWHWLFVCVVRWLHCVDCVVNGMWGRLSIANQDLFWRQCMRLNALQWVEQLH
jgi:hypothetical protein